jgi:hypothetical protein
MFEEVECGFCGFNVELIVEDEGGPARRGWTQGTPDCHSDSTKKNLKIKNASFEAVPDFL